LGELSVMRYLSVFLPVVVLACGFPPEAALGQRSEQPLELATFCCDVTPPVDGHPLIWLTPVKEVETPLLAKGVVLQQGDDRYVLCAMDWCGLCNSSYELFRNKMAAAVKAPPEHVALHCVHQHTAPYTDGDAQRLLDQLPEAPRYVDFRFLKQASDRLAAAVAESLDRLQPFNEVGIAEARVEKVASSRRIFTKDGRLVVRMSSCKDPAIRDLPEGRIDPMLKTITFAYEGKPLVRLHYYATHPQSFYGDPRSCYDVPGFARERLQESEGVFQVYFTGCAGDVAMGKYNDGSPEAREQLTERLYRAMRASVEATELHPAGQIRWRSLRLELPARDEPPDWLDQHREQMADLQLKPVVRVRAATRVAFAQRADRPLVLSALSIGPATVLHLPGECMVEYQLYAQRVAGKRFLAVAAYGDLGPGYICTEKSFQEGGYEPSASRVAPRTERLLKRAIDVLLADPDATRSFAIRFNRKPAHAAPEAAAGGRRPCVSAGFPGTTGRRTLP